ncbi:major facilitator superfamily domain-containing protein [Fomitopsis serialis]|uniref:major facilitator superfamily domain-containing protein n=1 Tax=Fomitopsis serialis TaxID=139415 RepID=UPI002007E19A|nr:major facilitator superfamily domain-containing protein [Neoantrodia serialis]KAH9934316.1 major facilitator superfamily domain-containing protein [Neoantrodia serialis]
MTSTTDGYARGPWRAWLTVVGAFLMQFSVVGFMSAFGVMQAYYVQTFLSHSSVSAISWIGSIQTLLDLTLGAFLGPFLDRGYLRHVVIGGSTIFVICHFMLSLAKPEKYYQVILSQGIGMGLGIGSIFLPTSVLISQHFKRRKALAMGIVPAGGSLGAVAFSIALNYLLNGSLGFGWSIRVTAFICLSLLLVGNLLLFDPKPAKDDMPAQDMQEKPPDAIGAVSEGADEKELDAHAEHDDAAPPPFLDREYVCILVQGFLMGLGFWFPSSYVQLFAEQKGVDQQLSFYTIAILNVANALGRIVPNWLGDRWGALEVYVPCLLINSGLQFALLGCSTPYGLVLFTIFYGFFSGAVVSLYLPVVASISTEGANVGKRMGIALFPAGIASLIGTPIGGALIGHDYVWWKGVVFAAVSRSDWAGWRYCHSVHSTGSAAQVMISYLLDSLSSPPKYCYWPIKLVDKL